MLHFVLHRPVAAEVIGAIASLVALAALASPLGLYKLLQRGLDVFAHAVGAAVTWVLMTLLFFVVFLPAGLILRRGEARITRGRRPAPRDLLDRDRRARERADPRVLRQAVLTMKLLGISCYYHDSAACLVDAGRIVAAAQEERFTRKKHDEGFPTNAVRYCLAEGGVGTGELDGVVFYDKPLLKFHRILETYLAVAPKGLRSAMMALPVWLREKLWIPPRILDALEECGVGEPKQIYFTEHHESHAASAFYPSPFEEAAVLTLDGVGEWATTTIGVGEGESPRADPRDRPSPTRSASSTRPSPTSPASG